MLQVVIPGISSDYNLIKSSGVIARECRDSNVFVAKKINFEFDDPSRKLSFYPYFLAKMLQLTLGGYPQPSVLIRNFVSATSQSTSSRSRGALTQSL